MAYEIVSTQSWNVLGEFEDEAVARRAVLGSLTDGGARPDDLVVLVSDEHGDVIEELASDQLAAWAGATARAV